MRTPDYMKYDGRNEEPPYDKQNVETPSAANSGTSGCAGSRCVQKPIYPQEKIAYIKRMTDLELAGILEEGTAHYPPNHPLHYVIPEAVRRLEKHFMKANPTGQDRPTEKGEGYEASK